MKKISSFILCALLMSCSLSNNDKSNVQNVAVGEGCDNINKDFDFNAELTYPGSEISFMINSKGDSLVIQPSGLSITNETMYHDITGYTVVNAEIGDLNIDSYPEVFVYLTSKGSGSYGKMIGYSVNNGKSVSQVYLPDISENNEVNKGYMGHDEMAIVENTFCQRFPIYKEGDSNAKPTGGTRQIQYKMTDGESGRVLEIDKVVEF